MTLKHFRIFTEVCRMESITKAAENLNMAQPAVSNSIRELETFYGIKLFERMNRKIYITDAGHCLLDYADSILTQFHESKDILQNLSLSTGIRIGSNVSFGANYLPELISKFRLSHPEIPIYTMIQNSSHIEACVMRNELDFAIIDTPTCSQNIGRHLLVTDEMTALCSPTFDGLSSLCHKADDRMPGIPLSHFKNIPLLMREPGSGSRDMLDTIFKQAGITPAIALESISTQALIQFCLKGQGVLFLPSGLASEYTKSGQLLNLDIQDANLSRQYYFIYHHKKYLTQSMKCFMEYLADYFQ